MRSPKPKTITCNGWDFNHPPIFFAALRWTNSVVKDWTWKVGDCELFYSIVSFSLSIVSLRGNKLKWPKEIWTTNSFLIPWRQSKWAPLVIQVSVCFFHSSLAALLGRLIGGSCNRFVSELHVIVRTRRTRHLQVLLRTSSNPWCKYWPGRIFMRRTSACWNSHPGWSTCKGSLHSKLPRNHHKMVLEHDVSLGNADSWGLMLVFHKHPQPSSTTAPRKFPSWVSLSTEPLPRLCEKIYGGWPDALKSDFNADRHHGPIYNFRGGDQFWDFTFQTSGHLETKCHKASPQITVFLSFLPPTLRFQTLDNSAQGCVTRKKNLQLWWTLVVGGILALPCSCHRKRHDTIDTYCYILIHIDTIFLSSDHCLNPSLLSMLSKKLWAQAKSASFDCVETTKWVTNVGRNPSSPKCKILTDRCGHRFLAHGHRPSGFSELKQPVGLFLANPQGSFLGIWVEC